VIIEVILAKKGMTALNLLPTEWDAVTSLVRVLEPFKMATLILESPDQPTFSQSAVLIRQILKDLQPDANDSPIVSDIRGFLHDQAVPRLASFLEPESIYVQASFLDPRFKHDTVVTTRTHRKVASIIASRPILCEAHEIDVQSQAALVLSDAKRPKIIANIEKVYGPHYSRSSGRRNKSPAEQLDLYSREDPWPVNACPLAYWKSKISDYPDVGNYALELLCRQATSVQSERAFSMAGCIFTSERASMKPQTLSQLFFMCANKKYLYSGADAVPLPPLAKKEVRSDDVVDSD
jgi:hypothetical protein